MKEYYNLSNEIVGFFFFEFLEPSHLVLKKSDSSVVCCGLEGINDLTSILFARHNLVKKLNAFRLKFRKSLWFKF